MPTAGIDKLGPAPYRTPAHATYGYTRGTKDPSIGIWNALAMVTAPEIAAPIVCAKIPASATAVQYRSQLGDSADLSGGGNKADKLNQCGSFAAG